MYDEARLLDSKFLTTLGGIHDLQKLMAKYRKDCGSTDTEPRGVLSSAISNILEWKAPGHGLSNYSDVNLKWELYGDYATKMLAEDALNKQLRVVMVYIAALDSE